MTATETEQRPGELTPGHHGGGLRNRDHLPWIQRVEAHPAWHVLARVPQTVTALIPLPEFTIRDLLAMEKGVVIKSNVLTTEMIPIRIGSVRIAWGEFEVVGQALALRIAKLA